MGCAGSKAVDHSEAGKQPVFVREGDDAPQLPPDKLKLVKDMFKEWDIEGNGMIEIKALKGVTVNVGPQESQVLSQLIAMDYNGDGFVEASEWEAYFQSTASVLSDAEFQVIMDDLNSSGSHMVTVLRCKKMAGESTGPTHETSDEEVQEALAAMALPEEKKAAVEELFAIWDYKSIGKIAYKEINSAGLQVGPKEIKVLDDLKKMDTDGDEVVDLPEMLAFFGAVCSIMSEDEFSSLIEEMKEVANSTVGVAKMIAMTNKEAASAGVADEDEEQEEVPELSAAREELVKSLFMAFSDSLDVPIAIKTLEMETKTSVGPAKESVMSNLIAMDANGDGMLEYGEMKDYFKVCGAVLNDSEFDLVVGDMRDNASTAQMIKVATSMSSGGA